MPSNDKEKVPFVNFGASEVPVASPESDAKKNLRLFSRDNFVSHRHSLAYRGAPRGRYTLAFETYVHVGVIDSGVVTFVSSTESPLAPILVSEIYHLVLGVIVLGDGVVLVV